MNRTRQSSFRRIAIVGVGLIGGSLGLAIKQRFRTVHVVGVDQVQVLRRARARGAIDSEAATVQEGVAGADLILLATPLSSILELLPEVARHCSPEALVSDVGSVKASVVRRAARLFPNGSFIGGHPMAGVEVSGIDSAHPLLFENAVYVLTPTPLNPPGRVRSLSNFLNDLGARVVLLDPVVHDEVASAVSHLPQLTAVALMIVAGKRHPTARRHLQLAAGGFRDLTRVASSRFDIWRDILPLNRKEIKRSIRILIGELTRYERELGRSPEKLAPRFAEARRLRDGIPRSMKGFLHPLAEISVFVKDRPGMLAKLTTALARAGINIKDMELMKIREGTGGTFRLAFDSDETARKAARTLKREGFEIGS